MKFENTAVMNFKGAFRGLRNPLESWYKADSFFGIVDPAYDQKLEDVAYCWVNQELGQTELQEEEEPIEEFDSRWCALEDKYMDWLLDNQIFNSALNSFSFGEPFEACYIGPNDLGLAQRMIRAGSSDRKFMRQIMVCVDITGPLYWWKEFDTYKVGTVANSTSTMHKLASTPITQQCFEMDDYHDYLMYEQHPSNPDMYVSEFWGMLINDLEHLRLKYNETKDKKYWKELIRWLPEGWLQTRTFTCNYAVLRNIYFQRKNHRLTEWKQFCDWIESLPYSSELITYN